MINIGSTGDRCTTCGEIFDGRLHHSVGGSSLCIVSDPAPESILVEAERLVYGDRQADYGDAAKDFGRIAALWSVVLGTTVTAEQVCLCMVQVKVSRQMNRPKRDNLVDGAGYFACIEKIELGR